MRSPSLPRLGCSVFIAYTIFIACSVTVHHVLSAPWPSPFPAKTALLGPLCSHFSSQLTCSTLYFGWRMAQIVLISALISSAYQEFIHTYIPSTPILSLHHKQWLKSFFLHS
ncbi:hypothetical protein L1887_32569 [Cichorium endivia]|nr:hypothetical protein L1887_32569 [Cichorium endivia]